MKEELYDVVRCKVCTFALGVNRPSNVSVEGWKVLHAFGGAHTLVVRAPITTTNPGGGAPLSSVALPTKEA